MHHSDAKRAAGMRAHVPGQAKDALRRCSATSSRKEKIMLLIKKLDQVFAATKS
jgi:hypothetical protein